MRYCTAVLVSILAAAMMATVKVADAQGAERSVVASPKALIELVRIGGEHSATLALSPDKGAVAFSLNRARVDTNDFAISWHVLELGDGGPPRRVGDGGDLMLNIRQKALPSGGVFAPTVKWSPDSRWIAYPLLKNGEIQIWRSRRDGGVQEQVTANDADVFGSNRYEALFEWSTDGSKIFYEVARKRDDMARHMAEDGRRGHLFDDRFQPHATYKPVWTRCGGTRHGEHPVASQACEPTLWTHDFETGTDRLATADEAVEYRRIRDEQDDRGVDERTVRLNLVEANDGSRLWFENVDPKTYPGFYPPLRLFASSPQGQTRRCEAEACQSIFLDAAWWIGGEVVFQRREGEGNGTQAFYSWAPGSGDVRSLLKTTEHFSACQPTADSLVCVHDSGVQPHRIVSLDPESGAVTELFNPNPHVQPGDFTRVDRLSWTDANGRSAAGALVYPRGYRAGRTYPLVLMQSGFRGFLPGGSGGEVPIHALAAEGFFVLQAAGFQDHDAYARYRGIDLAKADFVDYARRKRMLDSHRLIIGRLVEQGLVDPDRVATTGLSSHSSNARYALVNTNLFATALLSTGYSGPQSYWFNTSALRRMASEFVGGALPFTDEAEGFLNQEKLGYFARTHRFPPVLWQVADSELSHALFDHVILKDEGHPVEMYVFPDEYHVKHQPIHRVNVFRRNIQWVKFWLQGETVDDPMDPDQYIRWAALCRAYVDDLKAADDPALRNRADAQRCVRARVP